MKSKYSIIIFIIVLIGTINAIDWCGDLKKYKSDLPFDYEDNPLAAPDKCIEEDIIHKKKYALFPIAD